MPKKSRSIFPIGVIEQLDKFWSARESNKWLEFGYLSVYVRKARHIFPTMDDECTTHQTLDIANVCIEPSKMRSKGIFKSFLYDAEMFARSKAVAVYIENVIDLRFREFFVRRGYERATIFVPPSYILTLENQRTTKQLALSGALVDGMRELSAAIEDMKHKSDFLPGDKIRRLEAAKKQAKELLGKYDEKI